MRVIKFRAYNGTYMAYMKKNTLISEEQSVFGRWDIMQFTDLIDKNGNEIYEGDIVKASGTGIGEIYWCKLDAMFKCAWHDKVYKSVRGGGGEKIFRNHEITLEVIGNIYQNPELLLCQ